MRFLFGRSLLAFLVVISSVSFANAQDKQGPIGAGHLIALVAGNSLSENVVREIESRGLGFRASEQFRTFVSQAGGDARVLSYLRNAPANSPAVDGGDDVAGLFVQQLSTAGKLIRDKKFAEGVQELTAALKGGDAPEVGFVMGELLVEQKKWQEASEVYLEVLRQEPDFSEAHTKLSFVLYRMGMQEDSLRESKIVLAQYPDDAEAHKNAGLAFQELQKFDASEHEFSEALRLKPDYAVVHYDFGILYFYERKFDQAIVEYKKSLTLDPKSPDAHYNLGLCYANKGDFDSAIREYREAKLANPQSFEARQELGRALMQRNMNAEAVLEFRELEAMAPNSPICHDCLGTALYRIWDFSGAEKEFHRAIKLDPTDFSARLGLGGVYEQQKDYDASLAEYRKAENLDDTSADAHRDIGRILLIKRDFPNALTELKSAENLAPSSATTHNLYGQALQGSGDLAAAISEFKQAIAIDPKQAQLKLNLAAAYEKNSDWVNALDQYRQAARTDPKVKDHYKSAQDRLDQHLAALRSSGNNAEAEALLARLGARTIDPTISERVDAAMQAGFEALTAGRPGEAEEQYKEAVKLAEKIQPPDDRLASALLRLGHIYAAKGDHTDTEPTLQRALQVTTQLYGAGTTQTVESLQALGANALHMKDYKSALDFYSRAVDVNEKTFGETSGKLANSLRLLSHTYQAQQDYAHAEPYLLRAARIYESLYGQNESGLAMLPSWELCNMYNRWNKPEKAEPCFNQILVTGEKQYGVDSPELITTLTGEAKALRLLGRTDEAAKVEQRLQAISSAARQAAGPVSTSRPLN